MVSELHPGSILQFFSLLFVQRFVCSVKVQFVICIFKMTVEIVRSIVCSEFLVLKMIVDCVINQFFALRIKIAHQL